MRTRGPGLMASVATLGAPRKTMKLFPDELSFQYQLPEKVKNAERDHD